MAYNAEQSRANRLYYLSIGKCPKCGGRNNVEPGTHRCRACALRESENNRKRKAKRIGAGVCSRCGGPLDDSRWKTCQKCRDYNNKFKPMEHEQAKKVRERRKDEGKCVVCGIRWAEPGRTLCEKCNAKHKQYQQNGDPGWAKKYERRQARIDAGLCIDCGAPTQDGRQRCQRCIEMRRDSTRKYKIIQKIKREAKEARQNANHA